MFLSYFRNVLRPIQFDFCVLHYIHISFSFSKSQVSDSITQRGYLTPNVLPLLSHKKRIIGLWFSAVSKGWVYLNKSGVIKVYLFKIINYIKSRNYAMLVSCSKWFDHAARISCTQETENRFVVFCSLKGLGAFE